MVKQYDFSVEKRVTQTYLRYRDAHRAIRELRCMEQMYPDIFLDILPGDLFAGRIKMSHIGFSPEPGGLGYYCDAPAIREILAEPDCPDALRLEMEDLLSFWETESTSAKVRASYPDWVAEALPSDNWTGEPLAAAPLYRMAGTYPDYAKLLKLGIPGLMDLVREKKVAVGQSISEASSPSSDARFTAEFVSNCLQMQSGAADKETAVLYDAMCGALELLCRCCTHYRDQAREKGFPEIAETLVGILEHAPRTLREAIQLMWLYILISGTYNYGRMDDLLGDFLAKDLETGELTEDTAQELFNGFWYLMDQRRTTWNGRVILGGRGRRNEANADRVALMGMEASRIVKEAEPQLTLRLYEGMNPELLKKALEVIGEGTTYPMLYNDNVNIPAVANAFDISLKEAEDYVPFGCGEYVINHKSVGSPNGIINLLKVLEITLRNGKDGFSGKNAGLKTGDFSSFDTFEQLWDAYCAQTEYFINALAVQEEIEYRVTGEEAPFLFLSLLYDDCLERGKGIFSGGVHYLGGTVETYGNINTADSLTAIKELIYDRKVLSPQRLLEILDADFEGYPEERKLLQDAPKYGNDDPVADAMAVKVHEHICHLVRSRKERANLHSYLLVIINNSANTTLGQKTAASADGRGRGMYMANANNPFPGNDKKGLTAMLNSLVKLRPDNHAGAVQNMKFSPELFRSGGVIVKSLLKTYFEQGGTQAMISVVNRKDLEQAMLHPELYPNLFVRVGGFSARFVELERDVQLEILKGF